MTSNDHQQYVTVEVYNDGNNKLEKQIITLGEKQDKSFAELKSEIQATSNIALVNSAKIEAYHDSMNTWFVVLTAVIALIGILVSFAGLFREMYKDYKQEKAETKATGLTERRVQDMINASISQTVNEAVAKALADFRLAGNNYGGHKNPL